MLQCYKSITLLQPKACANRGSIHQLVQSLKREKTHLLAPQEAGATAGGGQRASNRLLGEPTTWWPVSHHSREASRGGRLAGEPTLGPPRPHQGCPVAWVDERLVVGEGSGVGGCCHREAASLGRRRWGRPERQLEAEWAASG